MTAVVEGLLLKAIMFVLYDGDSDARASACLFSLKNEGPS